jgi:hypothetical protein
MIELMQDEEMANTGVPVWISEKFRSGHRAAMLYFHYEFTSAGVNLFRV